MGFRDHLFLVAEPVSEPTGWTWCVTGQRTRRHGPQPSREAALEAQHDLLGRWQRAARARGGWVWRQTSQRWVVTLPESLPVGGLPFEHRPCNRGP